MRAEELRRAGHKIYQLTAGEPDFDTPVAICDAAAAAIKQGKTRYTATNGIVELRDAIRKKFMRDNHLEYDVKDITVGAGAKQIIYNCLMASLNPGDEVIIPAPYWVSYIDIARLAGGVAVIVPCGEEIDFKITPSLLNNAITPKTKWLMINNPGNPTGAMYAKAELKGLAEVLLKPENAHVFVLTDDIYESLIYDDSVFHTLAEIEPELKSRVLTVNGFSKTYAMTGWRLGYAAGPSQLINAINLLNSQSTSCPSSFSQWAAIAALEGDQSFIAENNRHYRERRDFLVKRINEMPGLRCHTPSGAFYIFANCQGVIGKYSPKGVRIQSDVDFVLALLDEAQVALVQGAAFGMSPYVRLAYAASMDTLIEACNRLQTFCESLR